MVEVFKTNVHDHQYALIISQTIRSLRPHYTATFDLRDCDRIMRVHVSKGELDPGMLIALLHGFGFKALVLKDNVDSDLNNKKHSL